MEHEEQGGITPGQHEGIKKDMEHHVSFESSDDAADFFLIAKDRLLSINNWDDITESVKTRFCIVDRHGQELHRKVHKGDYITIDIPGPGSPSGDGKDWVMAEELIYDDFPDEDKECVSLRLRPVSSPLVRDAAATHFFTSASTSTFIIERHHNKLIAKYRGRNEKPNTEADSVIDKIRNTVVAVAAFLGFSDVQWEGLIKGFLRPEER